jgi:hypothetical protein
MSMRDKGSTAVHVRVETRMTTAPVDQSSRMKVSAALIRECKHTYSGQWRAAAPTTSEVRQPAPVQLTTPQKKKRPKKRKNQSMNCHKTVP